MDDPRNRQYTNGEITVFWIPSKCIHATTCFRELIEVFNPGRRPWVNMEGAPSRKIAEVVNKCPTQSLTWKYNKDLTEEEKKAQFRSEKKEETPESLSENPGSLTEKVKPTSIRIMPDGPIVAEGQFRIIGADNRELSPTRMTSFCRCGNSGNMPHCDGAHRKIGFTD